MAKRAIENDFGCDIDLADTLFGQIYSGEIKKSLDISPSEIQTDFGTDNIQLLSNHSLDTSLNEKVMIKYPGPSLLRNSVEIIRFLVV